MGRQPPADRGRSRASPPGLASGHHASPPRAARHHQLKLLFALLALSLSAEAAAQQVFKCKDAAGKITYSSQECRELGLTSAGEIKGEVNVSPGFKAPPPPASPPSAAKKDAPPAQSTASTDGQPDPDRRCFTVKTATGTATRCNDKPEETDSK